MSHYDLLSKKWQTDHASQFICRLHPCPHLPLPSQAGDTTDRVSSPIMHISDAVRTSVYPPITILTEQEPWQARQHVSFCFSLTKTSAQERAQNHIYTLYTIWSAQPTWSKPFKLSACLITFLRYNTNHPSLPKINIKSPKNARCICKHLVACKESPWTKRYATPKRTHHLRIGWLPFFKKNRLDKPFRIEFSCVLAEILWQLVLSVRRAHHVVTCF